LYGLFILLSVYEFSSLRFSGDLNFNT
jgi:hypothetical protein